MGAGWGIWQIIEGRNGSGLGNLTNYKRHFFTNHGRYQNWGVLSRIKSSSSILYAGRGVTPKLGPCPAILFKALSHNSFQGLAQKIFLWPCTRRNWKHLARKPSFHWRGNLVSEGSWKMHQDPRSISFWLWWYLDVLMLVPLQKQGLLKWDMWK